MCALRAFYCHKKENRRTLKNACRFFCSRKLEVAIWKKCDRIYSLSIKEMAVNKKRNEHPVWTALSQPHGRKTRFIWL